MKRRAFGVIAALFIVASCSDRNAAGPENTGGSTTPPRGLTVSNAFAATDARIVGETSGQQATVTYVSASPGSFTSGTSILIRNRKSGATRTVSLLNGGFDPVSIAASGGDSLELSTNLTSAKAVMIVPTRRVPVIVRTSPPKGATDVPLNARVTIVFSEPMAAATLTGGSLQLRRNGTRVDGTITIASNGLSAEFAPTTNLELSSTYSLSVDAQALDMDGDALAGAFTSSFATLSADKVASVTIEPRARAIAVGGTFNLVVTVHNAAGQMLLGKSFTWTTSNSNIASVGPTGLVTGISAGVATITVTIEGVSAASVVSVMP